MLMEETFNVPVTSSTLMLENYLSKWHSLLKDDGIENESSYPRSILEFKNKGSEKDNVAAMKHHFEYWKTFSGGKSLTGNYYKNRKKISTIHDEEKRVSIGSSNLVNLNKILFTNEIELLRSHWNLWKELVKTNKETCRIKPLTGKGRNFHKISKVDLKPLVSKNSTSTASCVVLSENNFNVLRDYFHLWRRKPKDAGALEILNSQGKETDGFISSPKEKSSDIPSVIHSKQRSWQADEISMLRLCFNNWRKNSNLHATKQTPVASMNKIDKFLSAIRDAKMKTVQKCRPNHSTSVVSMKRRARKISDPSGIEVRSSGDGLEQPGKRVHPILKSSKPTYKLDTALESIAGRNSTISAIRSEVNTSLKEAHYLLEETIASSFKGNCARRKQFIPHTRKVSQAPLEMPIEDIVERMKMREMERAKRWQLSKERKEKIQHEKMMKMAEEEKEKLRLQELLKKKTLQEIKERKRQKIEQEKLLEEARLKYRQLNLRAFDHYNATILHKSLNCLINELNTKYLHEAKAHEHYNRVLTMRRFHAWRDITAINNYRRMQSACIFYERMLLNTCFRRWIRCWREFISNRQAAIDYHEMRTQEIMLAAWNRHTCDMIIELNLKLSLAEMFYFRNLLKRSFHCWKKLPEVLESERARERIKNSFRLKVLEIIPDFCPQVDDSL